MNSVSTTGIPAGPDTLCITEDSGKEFTVLIISTACIRGIGIPLTMNSYYRNIPESSPPKKSSLAEGITSIVTLTVPFSRRK